MNSIIIFIPSLGYGGAERVTVRIANYLSRKYNVNVVTLKKEAKEYELASDVRRINLDSKSTLSSIFEMRKLIKNIRPYFTITMFAPMYIVTYFAQLGLGVPQIVSERNDPKRFAGKELVKRLYQFLLKRADGIVFQTNEAASYYYKSKNNKSIIIYNPIIKKELPDVNTDNRLGRVINIGRLHPQKNQKMLIDAFIKLHHVFEEYKLDIYGAGELSEYLTDYISENNATGYISLKGTTNDVLGELNKSELFVLSSDFEGMPNTLIEAMCMGVPSISTDCPCGGPREIIENGENGILVPVGDSDSLFEAMKKVLSDESLEEKMAHNAERIRDVLDINKIGNQWIDFCEYISEEKRKDA
mgnify:FL=1